MQIPSNLILNSIPYPRLYMAAVVVLWGTISALTAVSLLLMCDLDPHLITSFSFAKLFLIWSFAASSSGSLRPLSIQERYTIFLDGIPERKSG